MNVIPYLVRRWAFRITVVAVAGIAAWLKAQGVIG